MTSDHMSDQVSGMPEPELSGPLRPEPDTGGGDSSQYTVIDDIGVRHTATSE